MLNQMNCQNLANVTGSPALEDGALHSDSLEFQMMNQSGLEAAPVSRSQSEILKQKAKQMSGTFGQLGLFSSKSDILQSSLENKLRAQFPTDGLMTSETIWKRWNTPSGRPFCQLALTVRSMSVSGCSGLPTPNARDGKDISTSGMAYAASKARHTPCLVTWLLMRGVSWMAISAAYCHAMGYPSKWNEMQSKAMVTQSTRRPPRILSKQPSQLSTKPSTPSAQNCEIVSINP